MGTLRKTLRDISHNISDAVCSILGNVSFLRNNVGKDTPDVRGALDDLSEAATETKELAHALERATRSNATTTQKIVKES